MAAESKAAALMVAGIQSGPSPYGRVAAIGAGDPAGAHHAVIGNDALRTDAGNLNTPGQSDTGVDGLIHHQLMQLGAPQTESMSVRECGLDGVIAIAKPNPAKRVPLFCVQIQTERTRGGQAIGHDAFAASLVDRRHGRIGDRDRQAAATRSQCGSQAGRASANHEKIRRTG
jgi:hypothetical protein